MDEIFHHIEAFDCLPFNSEIATAEVLQEFIESQSDNIFWLSADYRTDDESKLAEYNYRNKCWNAGRFVGEAIFKYRDADFKITIKPRFGEKVLFRMLEEIFNIRITTSASQHTKNLDWQHYIKRIIAFIWLQKLANANLHGLPKVHINREHKGRTIRGRLNVRKSIKSFHQTNEIISVHREKQIDLTIAQIIYQAYHIVRTDFEIGKINIPESAQQAINKVKDSVQSKEHVSDSDYKNIRYKKVYIRWKPLVDLSWDIIKRKQLSLKQDKAKNGFGFFIDMAELWEQYLRSILKKQLFPLGWLYKNDKEIAYKGYFYQRTLIPDLVFQKENYVAVWDAKYKRMLGRHIDVDRSDFFQIHTYILNYLNHKKVKAGGLLYPISTSPNFESYKSPFLINEEGIKLNFHIDGIELTEASEAVYPQKQEAEFLRRILTSIEIKKTGSILSNN